MHKHVMSRAKCREVVGIVRAPIFAVNNVMGVQPPFVLATLAILMDEGALAFVSSVDRLFLRAIDRAGSVCTEILFWFCAFGFSFGSVTMEPFFNGLFEHVREFLRLCFRHQRLRAQDFFVRGFFNVGREPDGVLGCGLCAGAAFLWVSPRDLEVELTLRVGFREGNEFFGVFFVHDREDATCFVNAEFFELRNLVRRFCHRCERVGLRFREIEFFRRVLKETCGIKINVSFRSLNLLQHFDHRFFCMAIPLAEFKCAVVKSLVALRNFHPGNPPGLEVL